MRQYVCAFRGRRDDYQVPLALAECNKLDCFITDAYSPASFCRLATNGLLPPRWKELLERRWKPGISRRNVHCLWTTAAIEHTRHRLGYSRMGTFAELDHRFSLAAATRARHARANLLLYTPYAWEAFAESRYPRHTPRKVLFQYHPHIAFENRLLAADVTQYPEIQHSHAEETGSRLPDRLRTRIADCWKAADLIFCASTFTRHTLIEAGADDDKCVVAPYGVDIPPLPSAPAANHPPPDGAPERFRALFVGSGVQRKGLHHLLHAWQRAHLPSDSELTLVCRNLDPGLEKPVACSRATRLLRGVRPSELPQLYRSHSLLVMPSLTEGFGQVFLEALGSGCPVLGTAHSGLPDLGGPADGIFTAVAGNIEHLASCLEHLGALLPARSDLRIAAATCACRFPWTRFRQKLASLL